MFHIPGFPTPFMWRYRLHLPISKGWALYLGMSFLAILVIAGAAFASSKDGGDMDAATVQSVVLSFANNWDPQADPLVEVMDGVMAKRSNVDGIIVGGVRYYYRTPNSYSFDPVSLGTEKRYETISVVDEGTQWEMIIYRMFD